MLASLAIVVLVQRDHGYRLVNASLQVENCARAFRRTSLRKRTCNYDESRKTVSHYEEESLYASRGNAPDQCRVTIGSWAATAARSLPNWIYAAATDLVALQAQRADIDKLAREVPARATIYRRAGSGVGRMSF